MLFENGNVGSNFYSREEVSDPRLSDGDIPISLAGTDTGILFVATKLSLSRQSFCRDKHNFVATNVLSRKAYFCRDKTRLLSRQTAVCRDKTFVATKMIFVAAPASDIPTLVETDVSEPSFFVGVNPQNP